MKRILSVVIFLAIGSSAFMSFGWNREGHQAIAGIAELNLTPKTRTVVESYLDGKSIVYFAAWPDQIRFMQDYALDYASFEHSVYYTKDLKAQGRGKRKQDAHYQINEAVQNLGGGKYRNLPDSVVAVNLKYLIHAVGDMHCPVHQHVDGRFERFKVTFDGEYLNFHTFWDSMATKVHAWSYSEFASQLGRLSKEQIAEVTSGDVFDWGEENVKATASIWEFSEAGSVLDKAYIYKITPLFDDIVTKAGYRLAHVLNTIFDPENTPSTPYCGEPFKLNAGAKDLSVISLNVGKYEKNATDNKWEDRIRGIVAMVQEEAPEVMGLQTLLAAQKDELDDLLRKYSSIGAGVLDGMNKGPMNAIYYRKDALNLEDSGTFWYSDTPDVPKTKLADAEYNCCATWAVFKLKSNGRKFIVLNTYLDFKSPQIRGLQAQMILSKLEEYGKGLPAIVLGGLNENPAGTFGTDMTNPSVVLCQKMIDGRRLSLSTSAEPSLNNYGEKKGKTKDYIFYTPEFEGLCFKTLTKEYEGVKYLSNRNPIRNTLRFYK